MGQAIYVLGPLQVAGYGHLVHVFDAMSRLCPQQYNTWRKIWDAQVKRNGTLRRMLVDFQKRISELRSYIRKGDTLDDETWGMETEKVEWCGPSCLEGSYWILPESSVMRIPGRRASVVCISPATARRLFSGMPSTNPRVQLSLREVRSCGLSASGSPGSRDAH